MTLLKYSFMTYLKLTFLLDSIIVLSKLNTVTDIITMYLLGILCLAAATAALPVLPDPPKLPKSTAPQGSALHRYIQKAATTSAPIQDKKDSEKIKKDKPQITSMVFPPPPQLPPFDYSILKKQKADQKRKDEDFVKQKAEKYKKEKESVIPEKLPKVEVPPNPEPLSDSKTGLQNPEIHANIPIVTSEFALIADKKDNETVKNNTVKMLILIPSNPELQLFDYSILNKQTADKIRKFNDAPKQETKKPQKEKEAVILDLEKSVEVEVPPKPATLIDYVPAPQVSELHSLIPSVTTDSAPVADKKDDKELKHNMVKIATVVIPPAPELPPFDYSTLGKQKSDQYPKSKYSTKHAAEKLKEEKDATTLDLVKPVKVKLPLNPATLPGFVTAPPESEISANSLSVANDSTPADKKDDEEVKHNIIKIAAVVMSPPPEIPPFNYSILRKQKADHNLKSEYSAKQAAQKPKEEKKMVILDLGPEKLEEPPNPATDTIAALPVSEVRTNILKDKKDNEEAKTNVGKIASDVIPPPPELLDYSILQKYKSEPKQKYHDFLKEKAEKSKKVKEVLITEKPVEVKVEEPPKLIEESKLVGDSKPMEESKPLEESKHKEELNKEPVKHSEIPVIIKWTIPTAPFLSKLISNYPSLPSFGLNWPSQKPSISRRIHIIYPKLNVEGIIHTN